MLLQPLLLPVRPMPTVRLMPIHHPTNHPMPFQPMTIRPSFIHINTPIKPSLSQSIPSQPPLIQRQSIPAVPLALPDRQPLLQCKLWHRPHPDPFLDEQQAVRPATRAARGKSRPSKAPSKVQVLIPQGLSPIPRRRHGAVAVRTSGTSVQQAIDVEDYEEQRKRRIAWHLEEDDRIYEQFSHERARMVDESNARLLEVRRQAEQERVRYADLCN